MATDKKARRLALYAAQFALAMRGAIIPLMAAPGLTPEQKSQVYKAFEDSNKLIDEMLAHYNAPDSD